MKFSTFFTIVAILGALFTLAFLIVPAETASHYGTNLDAAGVFIARLFGAALGGLSVGAWIVRNQDPTSIAARAAMWASVFFNTVSLFFTTINTMHGVLNSMGWSSVAINALILIGLFSFLSKKAAVA
ncbi:MAG TPA: hypothetical protein VFE53_23660 [Mucilaginibacter sp.]|jgi:hypothetical protein|nr:hypothetical protein [Mucilaginibacter sp.]